MTDAVAIETSQPEHLVNTTPILVVDDDAQVRRQLVRVLTLEGLCVLSADSGEAGLAMLETNPAAVVLSDQKMSPGMNGTEFLLEVRKRWPHTITLIISAYSESSALLAALNEAQAFRYVMKPWEDDDLILTIRHALQLYLAQEEVRRLAAANAVLIEQAAQLRNFSMMGTLGTALYDRFHGVIQDLLWQAIKEARFAESSDERLQGVLAGAERLNLAVTLSRLGRFGQFAEAGIRYRPMRVDALLESLRIRALEAIEARGWLTEVRLSLGDLPSHIDAHETTLEMAIHALLENALLHGSEAGNAAKHVHIEASVSGDSCVIDVIDDGPGIADHHRERIFDPLFSTFAQGSSTAHRVPRLGEFNLEIFGHVGLGLPLARWLLLQHEGQLSLIARDGVGSCFRATLPTKRLSSEQK